MSEVIGHDKIIARLTNVGIPHVAIFRGEKSVGKWTTALWVKDRMEIQDGDFLALKFLSMDGVRNALQFVKRAPHGKFRLLVAYLGGSTWSTQSAFLVALEKLPPTTRVILITPPDTMSPPLQSRGEIFDFSLLSAESVQQILMSRNFGESTAMHLASLSGGRVEIALRAMESNETKIGVIGAVRALLSRDAKTLDSFATRWSEEHTILLDTMCREAITGRPYLFTQEEIDALGRKLALKILTATRPEVRPRLVVHSQLMTVLRGE
ncbi:ASCE ATPase [Microbacterium phage Magritte]|nr:ASCE ATPase [Microbacterium phage Magritte]